MIPLNLSRSAFPLRDAYSQANSAVDFLPFSFATMLPENILLTNTPGPELERFLKEKKYSKILVLADEHTQADCYPLISGSLSEHGVLTIDSGEENKILETCEAIWQTMTDENLDRHAVLIIIGGGV